MIRRIIFGGIFFCLLLAIPLAFAGIQKVEVGGPFLAFLKATSIEFSKYKLQIPKIDLFLPVENVNVGMTLLNVWVHVANFFIICLNNITGCLNLIVGLIQFVFLMIKNLIQLKDTMASYPILFE